MTKMEEDFYDMSQVAWEKFLADYKQRKKQIEILESQQTECLSFLKIRAIEVAKPLLEPSERDKCREIEVRGTGIYVGHLADWTHEFIPIAFVDCEDLV
jgi:hypothetical protein